MWDAIALHTTPGIAEHKENEVALLFSGVGLDVMGDGYDMLTEGEKQAVLDVFPGVIILNKILFKPFMMALNISQKQPLAI